MKMHFHTNLDEAQRDVGDILPMLASGPYAHPIPRVGERISIPFRRDNRVFSYELAVVAVRYEYPLSGSGITEASVRVELHIPQHQASMSIADWTTWFNKHRKGREW
jgi:hypothetical protein